MSARRILLINPNISELVSEILAREARAIAGARAEIHAVAPTFGSGSLECRAEAVIAAHGVLEAIATNSGYDATIIAAFGDPGLEAAREISTTPVFGLGQSGLRAVSAKGLRYAIVTVGPRLRRDIERAALFYAPESSLVALRFLDVSVLEAARHRASVEKAALAAIDQCVKADGAEAILLAGAPFAGMARVLAQGAATPIYDGLEAAVECAIAAPRSDTSNVATSRPAKERRGVSPALADRIDDFHSGNL